MPSRAFARIIFKAECSVSGLWGREQALDQNHVGAEPVRELPRRNSIFDLMLAEDGPVIVPDILEDPRFREDGLPLRRLDARSFAAVPVRSRDGHILGQLIVFSSHARRSMARDELRIARTWRSLASSQVELAPFQEKLPPAGKAAPGHAPASERGGPLAYNFPTFAPLLKIAGFSHSSTSLRSSWPPIASSALRRSFAGAIPSAVSFRPWISFPPPKNADSFCPSATGDWLRLAARSANGPAKTQTMASAQRLRQSFRPPVFARWAHADHVEALAPTLASPVAS